jgi:hypothetical protein
VPELTDYEAAEAMRDGAPSPLKYGDFWLFDVRVTGTGMAYRESLGEWALRDPATWLSTNFVKRAQSMPVIFQHPPDSGLNSEEYRERAIGQTMLAYVKGDEVWAIAKIYDASAAKLMQTTHCSTSPGVTPPEGSTTVTLESGHKVLDEGLPRILDHLAICSLGVWDKGGPPEGVRLDALDRKDATVTEEEKKALEEKADAATKRADAADKAKADAEKERDDAKKRADEMELADKARKDAAEAEEKAEKERADKAKRDSRKDRHAKHDGMDKGEVLDCSRCDAEEKAEEEKERDDKAKRDAAMTAKIAEVDANVAEELKDARARMDSMAATIKALETNQQPMSHGDADKIAKAYHRADSVLGMFGEKASLQYPGEQPRRYEARLIGEQQKLLPDSSRYKNAVFNDSLPEEAFSLMHDALEQELLAEAKNPVRNDAAGGGRLVARVTRDNLGRTRTEYHGSSRAGLGLFVAPSFVGKIVKPERV